MKDDPRCECDMCEFARTLSCEIVELEETNGLVVAVLQDGSRTIVPFLTMDGAREN